MLRITVILSLLCVCALAQPTEAPPPWAAPPIDRAVTVFDGHTGEIVTFGAMLDKLAGADAVFLGESHTDETTHRVELAVYQGLLSRRSGAVVLAMEMFDRDVQGVLDAYLAHEIDEPEFVSEARAWGQYRSAYRPMIEHARTGGYPVVASNFPRPLTRRVAMEGVEVLETLEPEERSHTPAELFPNTPEYWKRVDNAVRGHLAMMRRDDSDGDRLGSTQTLWDNAMGESCSLALDANPGSMVLHVNGGFHSAYWGGTVRQFSLRKPEAKVLTVDINPTRNPSIVQIGEASKPVADFVVMAEARATDLNEGTLTVAIDSTLKYRLHLPEGMSDGDPVPLLIWLGDDGLTAQDGMDLWKDRLGDDVAIAVLEPTYRAQMPDLSEGGRWFWPDSFSQDVFSVVSAADKVWAYLLRYHNIDPARVCIAGEGTGATIAAVIALQGDRMSHTAFAFGPKQYAKLKDFPLPLPEYNDRSDIDVSLTVLGTSKEQSWWNEELTAYGEIGATASFKVGPGPDSHSESTLRAALELPASGLDSEFKGHFMRVPTDSPRARHWSRLHALRFAAETGQSVSLLEHGRDLWMQGRQIAMPASDPESVADDLPKCPGPFGGTTILVLPKDLSADEVAAWLALEENDPLNAKSRFHRLRIATTGEDAGDRSLSAMLNKLESENRKNVLVVPAEFCADALTMQSLERQTRDAADRMTIQWLPGLGGVGGLGR